MGLIPLADFVRGGAVPSAPTGSTRPLGDFVGEGPGQILDAFQVLQRTPPVAAPRSNTGGRVPGFRGSEEGVAGASAEPGNAGAPAPGVSVSDAVASAGPPGGQIAGLNLGSMLGLPSGINLTVGPTGTVSIGPNFGNGVANAGAKAALTAAGVPTSVNPITMLAPGAASFLGPAGLAIGGYNTLVSLASAIANANGVPTVEQAMQNNEQAANSNEGVNLAQTNQAHLAAANAAIAAAGPGGAVNLTNMQANARAGAGLSGNTYGGPGGYSDIGAKGPTAGGLGNTTSHAGTNFSSNPAPSSIRGGPDNPPDVPTPPEEPDPEGIGLGGVGPTAPGPAPGPAGVGSTEPDGSTANAPTDGGGGGGGGGGSCLLATYALNTLKPQDAARSRQFFQEFYQAFRTQYPKESQRLFGAYQGLARKILAAIAKLSPAEQQAYQRFLYEELVQPTGEHVEAAEIDDALGNMIEVLTTLTERFGIPVPKNLRLPGPLAEAYAAAREPETVQINPDAQAA